MLKQTSISPGAFSFTEKERANLRQMIDYSTINSIPEIWASVAARFGDELALYDPHSKPEVKLTYRELSQQIEQFAAGLQAMGIQPGTHVGLFADNSPRWMIADQGIMMAGATNIVRSAQADPQELIYILQNSDSTSLVVEDLKTLKQLQAFLEELPLELVIVLADEEPNLASALKIVNFQQLMTAGANYALKRVQQNRDTVATLLYTSGTTGKPKGVMLTHGNILHQVNNLGTIIQPGKNSRLLTILPTWHAYERTAEYFVLSQGCTLIYTNLRYFKKDLKEFKPNYMIGVPRLWESIYEGIQKQLREQPANKQKLVQFFLKISEEYVQAKRVANRLSLDKLHATNTEILLAKIKALVLYPLHALGEKVVYGKVREATGGQLKAVISGGGSLARHLDTFYEIINVTVLVGYGLTETAPVTNARRFWENLRYSAGKPLPETEVRIVNPETKQDVRQGESGLVLVRGPQIMQGYYKNPEATAKAIDGEGWFDTGDLGWVTSRNDLVLTGRAKDTIVLTNGENIEPQPIEDACVRSAYIDQMMLVGQDQRSLGALIVPNLDALQQWVKSQNLSLKIPTEYGNQREDLDNPQIESLYRQELNREVKNRPGYRADDRIAAFRLILEPFSIENGMMTQTLKIKRPVVTERYRDIIDGMFETR
ncbi:MAG: long-chain fatty acid--CoA ligase [Oscillatoria sp. PMC 1068.18]|nr:long-chain fatty acid--CoA ligase [Oscillatoria sp. PMC 1076.18]MEC4987152.1 long-chain fatty acid--CoA ligase [Oscillatoria sp. PMC 1068.18]